MRCQYHDEDTYGVKILNSYSFFSRNQEAVVANYSWIIDNVLHHIVSRQQILL